jgi:hypothetical protein
MKLFVLSFVVMAVLMFSCSQKPTENRRRGIDYEQLKQELNLSVEQGAKYDAVIEKFNQVREASRAANTGEGGKMDRSAMFEKMEAITNSQTAEMAQFLSAEQLNAYKQFIQKNSRRRPGYSSELVAQLKTELSLDDNQSNMLDAVNRAFEKSYHDAHDIYHGNAELAREYWNKFDAERKAALKAVFSDEQYALYLKIIEVDQPVTESKKD